MRLKKIELAGFKSFADRTDFAFSDGITGIVGPNGCGKSNIIDCIKWALGGQSTKSLRSSEMMDVIFNGSEKRSPLGCAEVSLVFSNDDRALPVDYSEVAVTRRLYRSGESEYLINKQQVRLKDIKELFMGTGVGNDSYFIIELNKIERILTGEAKDRQLIFEEAAGISKYKARKREAASKLERVDQDLLRLGDTVGALQSSIRSLKIQAGKAVKYKEYSVLLKEKKTALALHTYHKLVLEKERIGKELKLLEEQLSSVVARMEEAQHSREALESEAKEFSDFVQSERQRQMALETTVNTLRQRIEDSRQRADELREESAQKQSELEILSRKMSESLAEQQENVVLKNATETRLIELQKSLSEQTALYEEYSTGYRSFLEKIEEKKSSGFEQTRKRSDYQNHLTETLADIKNFSAANEKLVARFDALKKEVDAAIRDMSGYSDDKQLIDQEIDELKHSMNEKNDALKQSKSRLTDIIGELVVLKESRTKLSSKKEMLEQLEAHQDGIAQGVTNLLGFAKSEANSGVVGMLSEMIDVEGPYISAIEAGLAEKLQFVVARTADDARNLARYLSVPQRGRATVASLSSFANYSAEWSQVPAHPDVLGRAHTFVKAQPEAMPLVEYLLGGFVVVKDVDAAYDIVSAGMATCPMVTLGGEVVDPNGMVTSGQQDLSKNILSRRFELKSVTEQMKELDLRLAEMELDRHQLGVTVNMYEEQVNALRHKIYEQSVASLEKQKDIDSINHKKDMLVSEGELVQTELKENETQLSFLREKEMTARTIIGDLDKLINDIEAEISDLTVKGQEYERRKNQINEAITGLKVANEGAQKTMESVTANLAAIEEDIYGFSTSKVAVAAAIEKVNARIAEAEEFVKTKSDELVFNEADLKSLAENVGAVEARLAGFNARIADIVSAERAMRDEERKVSDDTNRLKIEESTTQVNITNIETRIADEFQTDVKEVYAKYLVSPSAGPQTEAEQEADVAAQAEASVETTVEAPAEAPVAEIQAAPAPAEELVQPVLNIDYDALIIEVEDLKRKLAQMENVNLTAIDELKEKDEKFQFFKAQQTDLVKSKEQLEELIRKLNRESREIFLVTLEKVRENFNNLFRKLFGGGKADIMLEESVDILEAGIEIMAKPPGKELASISLLSGGEKTLTTLALIMGMFMLRPSAFCLMDEVDAPLDENNIGKFIALLKEFSTITQFIVISHNKKTMAHFDTIYGVTMQEKGVTKKVSVKLVNESQPAVA